MPVEVTKYRCAFKCGKRAVSVEKDMRRHEMTCWKNPENKTCNTCTNRIYEYDNDGYNASNYRGCKLEQLNSVLESSHEVMSSQTHFHVRPVYHCPYHNSVADENIGKFAESLLEEINGEEEGTLHYPYYNKPVKKELDPDEIPF